MRVVGYTTKCLPPEISGNYFPLPLFSATINARISKEKKLKYLNEA